MTSYGTMIAVRDGDGTRFLIPAFSTPNARSDPTIVMLRRLLAELELAGSAVSRASASGRRVLLVQYDDRSHHDVGSVAYCRPRDAAATVRLIPDTFFFFSGGYRWLREPAKTGVLPAWEARQDILFWRGSPTNNGKALDGSPIERMEQIPRIALCRAVRGHEDIDVAVMNPWGFVFPAEEMTEYLTNEGILRPGAAMLQQANYRYLLDVDGVASAWSFFEKLLLGGCVLKVGSPFEQWFYPKLREWEHFIPVAADFNNLVAQLEWCREHPRQAQEIAEEGQRFALDHTFAEARQMALDAIRQASFMLDEPARISTFRWRLARSGAVSKE